MHMKISLHLCWGNYNSEEAWHTLTDTKFGQYCKKYTMIYHGSIYYDNQYIVHYR